MPPYFSGFCIQTFYIKWPDRNGGSGQFKEHFPYLIVTAALIFISVHVVEYK